MPERSRSICHGTMLEWCSISEITTACPGFSVAPKECASRLMAPVLFWVKMTSSRDGALIRRATLSRTPS